MTRKFFGSGSGHVRRNGNRLFRKTRPKQNRRRRFGLRLESLESRRLLAAVEGLSVTWRVDEFTASGSYSYVYSQTDPSYIDRVPSGNISVTGGTVQYTSPIAGTFDVDARVTGNGSDVITGRPCSTYFAVHEGTMSGTFTSGDLQGTNSNATFSNYPSYTSIIPNVCEKTDTPTEYSPFNSELANLLTGAFDPATDNLNLQWSGPYRGGSISINVPPSVVQYTDNTPTDLVLSVEPDVAGILVAAEVKGRHLSPPSAGLATASTEVKLFYTSAEDPNTKLATLSLSEDLELHWNSASVSALIKDLETPPQEAQFLMIQVDPDNKIGDDSENNIVFLPLLDIQLKDVVGGFAQDGLKPSEILVEYEIFRPTDNDEDDKPFELQFVSASSNSQAGIEDVIYSMTVEPDALDGSTFRLLNEANSKALKKGKHKLVIDSSDLGLASSFADPDKKRILVVLDPDNLVVETDEHPVNEDNLKEFTGFVQDGDGNTAVLRTSGDVGNDEVKISRSGLLSVEWVGKGSNQFTLPSPFVIITGAGDDSVITSETSNPVLETLYLYGGDGNDLLVGGSADDTIEGGSGDDILIGGPGGDNIKGGPGAGDDVILGDGLQLVGGSVDDLVTALKGYRTSKLLNFTFQVKPIIGAADTITAGQGDVLVFGGSGGDDITGGSGTSIIFGDSFETAAGAVSLDLKDVKNSYNSAITALEAMFSGITMANSGGENILTGGSGINLIVGGHAPDTIKGGNGAFDILIGNESSDNIDGLDGFNLIIGGDESDELRGGKDGNMIFGDQVALEGFGIDVQALLQGNILKSFGVPSFELSGSGDDHIYGGSGFDFLVGGEGKDTINGGDGLNVAFGDEVELKIGGALSVGMKLIEIAGQIGKVSVGDVSSIKSAFESIYGFFEDVWAKLTGSDEELGDDYYGGKDTDIVFGGGGDDFLAGGAGIDFLVGGWGNDYFQRDPKSPFEPDGIILDWKFGGLGDDTFFGNDQTEFLGSTYGNDRFYGNGGDDVISAGSGSDLIVATSGNGFLDAGGGDDLIVANPVNFQVSATSQMPLVISAPPIMVTTLEDDSVAAPNSVTLRQAIGLANAANAPRVILFDSSLFQDVIAHQPVWIQLNDGELPAAEGTLVVVGPGSEFLMLDGANAYKGLHAQGNGTVTVVGIAIRNVDQGFDFGDAPLAADSGYSVSYPTRVEDDGASHQLSSLFLGASIDAEVDGVPTSDALGDNQNSSNDDEDGVRMLTTLRSLPTPATSSIEVIASEAGFLDAWFDWNRNGVFDDPAERVGSESLVVHGGANLIPMNIPANISAGVVYARFRLSSTGQLLPTGQANDGEVEDYRLNVESSSEPLKYHLAAPESGPAQINMDGTLLSLNQRNVTIGGFSATTPVVIEGTFDDDHVLVSLSEQTAATVELGIGNDVLELSNGEIVTAFGGDGDDQLWFTGDSQTIDLVGLAAGVLNGFEEINLDGANSTLRLSSDAVQRITGAGELRVRMGIDDTLELDDGWQISFGELHGYRYFQTLEKDGAKVLIESARPWRNSLNTLDVNGDRFISAVDSLVIINQLNRSDSPILAHPAFAQSVPSAFYDVSGDGLVTALDALLGINYLNSLDSGTTAPTSEPTDLDELTSSTPDWPLMQGITERRGSEDEVWKNIDLVLGDLHSPKTIGVAEQADWQPLHDPVIAAEPITVANSIEQSGLELLNQKLSITGNE